MNQAVAFEHFRSNGVCATCIAKLSNQQEGDNTLLCEPCFTVVLAWLQVNNLVEPDYDA